MSLYDTVCIDEILTGVKCMGKTPILIKAVVEKIKPPVGMDRPFILVAIENKCELTVTG